MAAAVHDTLPPEIHVCKARTCLAKGGDACLQEIEELAGALTEECRVKATGCLGYCSQGPNAMVVARRKRGPPRREASTVETKIRSLEASMRVVERATGERPNPEDPDLVERFSKLRAARAVEEARNAFHWNRALHGLGEDAIEQPALRSDTEAELLKSAGFPDAAVEVDMPEAIESYTRWTLQSVAPCSKHSAIFSFVSTDRKRSTPHPRGRGRLPIPITFHTTLLGEVGRNGEGPLPWIEREYTPVSTAKAWDSGRCDLLVKVYADGLASSWLKHREVASQVWLSKPARTLHVPSLLPDEPESRSAAAPNSSVLLVLAGTGVVALPQILAHRDPTYKLGISTPRRSQLRVPIDLLLSCREDDVLLLPEVAQWCQDGGAETTGLRHCTLMLTPPNGGTTQGSSSPPPPPPFPEVPDGVGDGRAAEEALRGVSNARTVRSRLSKALVEEAAGRMPRPCRVVVSGPGGFNNAAREMLADFFDESDVTILAA